MLSNIKKNKNQSKNRNILDLKLSKKVSQGPNSLKSTKKYNNKKFKHIKSGLKNKSKFRRKYKFRKKASFFRKRYKSTRRFRFRFRFKPRFFVNKILYLLKNRGFFMKNDVFRNTFRKLFNNRRFRVFFQKRKFKNEPRFSFRFPLKYRSKKLSRPRRITFRFIFFRRIKKITKKYKYKYKYKYRYKRRRHSFIKSKKKRKLFINLESDSKRRFPRSKRRFRRFKRRVGPLIRCKFLFQFRKPKYLKRQLLKTLRLHSKKRGKIRKLLKSQNKYKKRFLRKIAKRNPKYGQYKKPKKRSKLKISRLRPKFRRRIKKRSIFMSRDKLKVQKLRYSGMTREKILDTFSVFLRSLSFRGAQTVAEKMMSHVLFELKRRFSSDPLEILFIAMDNIRPLIFLKSVKKGGSIQKVPSFLPFSKQRHLGIRWLILGARTRSARNLLSGLVDEVSDAYSNKNCFSQRKRQELHKLALINRSFLRSFSK